MQGNKLTVFHAQNNHYYRRSIGSFAICSLVILRLYCLKQSPHGLLHGRFVLFGFARRRVGGCRLARAPALGGATTRGLRLLQSI